MGPYASLHPLLLPCPLALSLCARPNCTHFLSAPSAQDSQVTVTILGPEDKSKLSRAGSTFCTPQGESKGTTDEIAPIGVQDVRLRDQPAGRGTQERDQMCPEGAMVGIRLRDSALVLYRCWAWEVLILLLGVFQTCLGGATAPLEAVHYYYS